jgi:hypothetical protein
MAPPQPEHCQLPVNFGFSLEALGIVAPKSSAGEGPEEISASNGMSEASEADDISCDWLAFLFRVLP